MSLERKDGRYKLDEDVHAMLKIICEVDGIDVGEYVESLIVPAVRKRVHDATVLSQALARLGKTGTGREKPGSPGSGRE